ncbi:MAG: BrnT family toxin [Nitrospirota bacterium]
MLLFEWDPNKARKNLEIHRVSFDEASTAFRDTLSLTIYDPLHSEGEDRLILILRL